METGKKKLKVYCETSFVSYLTGRATTREPVASWQAASRQWWEAGRPSCDLFVSRYVIMEAEKGDAEQVARRMEVMRDIPRLDVGHGKIEEVAKALISEHALPENEITDAYHRPNAIWRTPIMTTERPNLDTPIDEIYRIRQEISAAYDHDPHKLFIAVVEQQKQRAREGQVYWGYNDAGELAPLPMEAICGK